MHTPSEGVPAVSPAALAGLGFDRPRRRPGRPERPVARSELLRVARTLFSAYGFDGVSMADIAAQGGLQKSSLFHHFPTKEALYREVLEGVIADIGGSVSTAMSGSASWEQRLDSAIMNAVYALGKDATRARLLLREFMAEDSSARETGDLLQTVLQTTTDFLDGGAAAGAWAKQDARHLVMTLAGLHVLYFAVPAVTKRLMGADDLFAVDQVAERALVVKQQVRRLMGLPTR